MPLGGGTEDLVVWRAAAGWAPAGGLSRVACKDIADLGPTRASGERDHGSSRTSRLVARRNGGVSSRKSARASSAMSRLGMSLAFI